MPHREKRVTAAVAMLWEHPDAWPTADREMLQYVLFYDCLQSAVQPDPERSERLFAVTNNRLSVEARLAVLQQIAEGCEFGNTSVSAFLPFLHLDDSSQVIATASLNTGIIAAGDNGESLGGPRQLVALALSLDDPQRTGSILGGVLSTGDRRVVKLVGDVVHELDAEAGLQLAHVNMLSAYAAVLDFYMDWMELLVDNSELDPDGRVLGAVAAAVARYCRYKVPTYVIDVERVFPATEAPPDRKVTVKHSWSFEEYGAILKERLEPVAEREPEPRVIPVLLEHWGS